MSPDITDKYLKKYSPSTRIIESNNNSCKYAVVVPAIAEYENIITFLTSFSKMDPLYFNDTLLFFVINNHPNSSSEIKENNKRSVHLIHDLIKKRASGSLKIPGNLNIGLIDASSPGNELPEKDAGVGLARKTGMDAALKMFPRNEKGIIICTDADCTFENNYLTIIVNTFKQKNADAAVINFRHNLNDPATAEAVICYEIFLRYYTAALKFAESPFAFHTIGSAMACTNEAYINVEGMNKRKAAEDFYFLEKLAKKFPIEKINETTVYLSSRSSWRVPFGTGQRVNRFLSNKENEYFLYHPDCFIILKKWNELFLNNNILSGTDYIRASGMIDKNLTGFLILQQFEKDWQNILNNIKNKSGIMKQKVRWFDGFRTLKLIHHLRDNEFGTAPMFDALDKLFLLTGTESGIKRYTPVPEVSMQMRYLELLRKRDIDDN